MTPEEITKLAEEYVADVYGGDTDFIDETDNVISWLLRTHCIVSKEKVEEIKENRYLKEYEFLTERCFEDLNPERMDWHDILRLCDGMYYALNQLLDETDK